MTAATNWLLAIIFGFLVLAAYSIVEPDDHSSDYADSAELLELQAAEAGTARQLRAGQALCNKERGPNSEARWTLEGHLVCTTRRGVVTANATAGPRGQP